MSLCVVFFVEEDPERRLGLKLVREAKLICRARVDGWNL